MSRCGDEVLVHFSTLIGGTHPLVYLCGVHSHYILATLASTISDVKSLFWSTDGPGASPPVDLKKVRVFPMGSLPAALRHKDSIGTIHGNDYESIDWHWLLFNGAEVLLAWRLGYEMQGRSLSLDT